MLRQIKEQIYYSLIPSFPLNGKPGKTNSLNLRFGFIDRACVENMLDICPEYPIFMRQQTEAFIAHNFDLLGSGPMEVFHGVACAGVEGYIYYSQQRVVPDRSGKWLAGRINRSNLAEAQRIWSFVSDEYRPIDWQLDFKSGYRWSEKTWFRGIRFGHAKGVDIKVPWELARMQHLPLLALAALFSKFGLNEMRDPISYFVEVRNQLFDFIATNPPGFGVNWSCSMDVGIRVANMLVAYDILYSAGMSFDPEEEQIFEASVRSHARHLAANLEWAPRFRGNHYLANVAGLLFASAYLEADIESDAWLVFATEEFFAEMDFQFHEDGSNFEASVCYHRLSAEICLWTLALINGLPEQRKQAFAKVYKWNGPLPPARLVGPIHFQKSSYNNIATPIPEWCWRRVAGMSKFTRSLVRPDGLVVQFGDNDSGRFITLGSGEQIRARGNPNNPAWSLDHGAFLAMADGIFGLPASDVCALLIVGLALEPLCNIFKSKLEHEPTLVTSNDSSWKNLSNLWQNSSTQSCWNSEFLVPREQFCSSVSYQYFAGMGVYVFRSEKIFLAVRCGEIGIKGLGAHSHCDQLAIELVIDGIDICKDPGTYLYTALSYRRNEYRSVSVHHAPRVKDREPANLKLGVFDLRGASDGECLYFGPNGFVGRHNGYGSWIYRMIEFREDRIIVRDFSPGGLKIIDPTPIPVPFSHAYGRLTLEK